MILGGVDDWGVEIQADRLSADSARDVIKANDFIATSPKVWIRYGTPERYTSALI